jgi:Zn-dependent peptidase ImmA (M78 family)
MVKMVNNTSKLLIKELAEFIALEHIDFITPLEKIAELEDLPIFYDDYGNAFDGMTLFDEAFYIHINTKRGNFKDSKRGRFTLAHELGHYFINNHRIGLKKNLLKPHLLMPEVRFRNECLGKKISFEIIKNLSEKFNVSITACAIRFADIGNHPIMIVYCEDNKVVWKWNSLDFPFKYLADGNKTIPIDSLAGQYHDGYEVEIGKEELWALDWFSCNKIEEESRKINEYFIPHQNKSLSIIWEL